MRTWVAVTGGLVIGFTAALAGTLAWRTMDRRSEAPPGEARAAPDMLELFRLPSGARQEMFLVPAGPDGIGEPALAASIFPGEDPPRQLATLLVANVSGDQPWRLDFAAQTLRCRAGRDASWAALETVSAVGPGLDPALALRLRGLGAGAREVTVDPRSIRHVLVALPAGTRFDALSDVQWGETALLRDKLDVERIRRFREDPAATTQGR